MFTGIVEETGKVLNRAFSGKNMTITVSAAQVLKDLKTGDSIAANGVCLTATSVSKGSFTADVTEETISVSTLGDCTAGTDVNLERSLRVSDRLSGHIVTGHVDGTGTIRKIKSVRGALRITIAMPENVAKYMIKKGSVAIDGISLTVAEVSGSLFDVAVIPHTFEKTTLRSFKAGRQVNLEADLIGKYIEKLAGAGNSSPAVKGAGTIKDFMENILSGSEIAKAWN